MAQLEGILTVDLHGKNRFQAQVAVDAALRRAGGGVYRLRLVHGYRGGTALKDFIAETYTGHPKVRRLAAEGDGVTVLVLREL